jgi:drug/metabolite transporter (DMT)-like permease
MPASAHRRGVLLISGSALAWSLGGLFTRLLPLDSWTLLAWRGVFGAMGILMVLVVLRQQAEWRAFWRMGWRGALFVAQAALGMTLYLTALRHTSVANVAVIYATTPLLAAALAWLVLREKPTGRAVVATLAALLGVAVMVRFGPPGNWLGDLCALGMTLSMAVTTVVARNYPNIPILVTACLSSLLSGLVAWPFGTPLAVTGHELWLLALFGFINFAIGLPLFTLGARLLPAIETALIGALDAPLAPLWVWLVFAEVPGASTLLGGVIVFGAVLLHLIAVSRLRT